MTQITKVNPHNLMYEMVMQGIVFAKAETNRDIAIDYTGEYTGIQFTFPNDWTVSVQWGRSNYCYRSPAGISTGETAETAIIEPTGQFFRQNVDDHDDVQGYQTFGQIMETIRQTAER